MAPSFIRHGPSRATSALLLIAIVLHHVASVYSIGVNYGMLGDNLPPPAQVAQFIKDKTIIDRVKLFDANPEVLKAFAGTGIQVAVTIPSGEIPNMVNVPYVKAWLDTSIKPFYPQTQINYILVGSEVLHWGPQNLIDNLVAAMRSIATALSQNGLDGIQVTTTHALSILASSNPPSLARFRPGWDVGVLAPVLQFHRETKSPFMVNPYPYFDYQPGNETFALFQPNKGIRDPYTRRTYTNLFNMLLDAVHMSMKRLGFDDVEIVAGETGWSSMGDAFEQPKCSLQNAAAYNGGLLKNYLAGKGTPLMPRKRIETYIFALFNEDQKPGSTAERNFGLFKPDFTPVYDIGIMRGPGTPPVQNNPTPTPSQPAPPTSQTPATPAPPTGATPAPGGGKWCVAKPSAADAALQNNINYACGQGIDCTPIQPGGTCFTPNTVQAHASYAMNAYYQAKGRNVFNCDFAGSGQIVSNDPSTGTCKYSS